MARFQLQKQKSSGQFRKYLGSVGLFAGVLILFFVGTTSVTTDTRRRQKERLEDALNRDITSCYALEGSYPPSLAYLKDHYGLTYDEDYFFVDYHIRGSNLLPDITIIEKGE
jgi:hypothetical protein